MSDFADRVRIVQSPETIAAGVSGLEGEVHGFTTPSVTGVDVIGGAPDDYALYVSLEDEEIELWFRPDLVELVNHNARLEIEVGGMKATRQADGSWIEEPIESPSTMRKFFSWLRK